MAGIGICPFCKEGKHEFHVRYFTDLGNAVAYLGAEAIKALKNNRICDCFTCEP